MGRIKCRFKEMGDRQRVNFIVSHNNTYKDWFHAHYAGKCVGVTCKDHRSEDRWQIWDGGMSGNFSGWFHGPWSDLGPLEKMVMVKELWKHRVKGGEHGVEI